MDECKPLVMGTLMNLCDHPNRVTVGDEDYREAGLRV